MPPRLGIDHYESLSQSIAIQRCFRVVIARANSEKSRLDAALTFKLILICGISLGSFHERNTMFRVSLSRPSRWILTLAILGGPLCFIAGCGDDITNAKPLAKDEEPAVKGKDSMDFFRSQKKAAPNARQ